MNANFDLGMNQYLGPPAGDSYYQYNTGAFNFDMAAYPNLLNEPLLPPTHSNLFGEFAPNYQSYPPAPAGHPNMSVSSAQGANMYPSISDYPPSNGSYPWINSPPSATMHPPISNPAPPVPQQTQAADDDQRVQQELLGLLDGFQQPFDDFYMNPRGPNESIYMSSEGQIMDNISIPSPYPGAGNDFGDASSPSSSLIKPPFDDAFGPDLTGRDDLIDGSMIKEDGEAIPESEDLSEINIRDLNKSLRDQGYSQEEQMEVKLIRRKQKNRVYAKNCRKNKEEKKTTMKTQKEQLEGEITDLKGDVERLRAQRNQYKMSYDMMQQRKQQNS